ncbi:hypothetical protein [Cytophaga hutchinsonii]|uniref:Lipoprotein n=1 Tax=Cytophaga hutchinsonii (strain ATCC 33406 / DSM 1761 / CIP 103989 / NBRC 15051 / NCIMB 9469 / D465) TaxID=269798 RepID=A0A6N4SND4_CYTH3|nr:hypothetical protein [Cytophaga hutchinsonii]ABG57802.1 hypothetical protein CHU_0514 [Cytophaga hutchinsonii ATCC 33406]SFX06018.1 hypothetical protein SAMN04487930_101355 [Cytophaga hutchinsonii ATCC 33406]
MKAYWIVCVSSLMLIVSCKEQAETKETAVSQKDTAVTIVQQDTAAHINKDVIRDYVPRVLKFKKMPDATRVQLIEKYEVFSERYIDYLLITQNKQYYSDIEQKDNKQAFAILRDETISLKEKIKKAAATFTDEDIARLDAADARMNAVIEKNP